MKNGGPIYTIPISAASLSTGGPWDLVGITAQSSGRLEVIAVDLTLISSSSGLAIQFLRGSTADSTGAAILPRNVAGWTGATTALFAVTGPSSTPVSTASAALVYAGAFSGDLSFCYRPGCREERINLTLSQRLHLRTTTPSTSATVYGTITVQDVGKGLPS